MDNLVKILIGVVVFHVVLVKSNSNKINSIKNARANNGRIVKDPLLLHANSDKTLKEAYDSDGFNYMAPNFKAQNPMYDADYNGRTDRANDYHLGGGNEAPFLDANRPLASAGTARGVNTMMPIGDQYYDNNSTLFAMDTLASNWAPV